MPERKQLTLEDIRAMKPTAETFELINDRWGEIAPLLATDKGPVGSPADDSEAGQDNDEDE